MRPGDRVRLFDGLGNEHKAELLELSKREVRVRIAGAVNNTAESPLPIELGQVISRGERMDYAVQKATELGVDRIVPLFSERCEVRLDASRQAKRQQHWQQVAISACEQCGRSRLPEILAPQVLGDWLSQASGELQLVLSPEASMTLASDTPPESVSLLVGPEGGLSEAEIERAIEAGFQSLRLGPRVLRTETAPVVALSLLQYRWGDIG